MLTGIPSIKAAQFLDIPVVRKATMINFSGFTANWTPVANAASYTIKVYCGSVFVDSINVSGQRASSVLVSRLIPGQTFTYKVIARGDGINYLDSPISASSATFTLLKASIPENKLKVILKLDDIGMGGKYATDAMEYLKMNNIKAGFGVVAKYLDNTSRTKLAPYLFATNALGDTLIEIWHHGLDHSRNASYGEAEFKGVPYDIQKLHFDSANSIVKRLLGVQMHSFGTPGNKSDSVCNAVLLTNPAYKVFMLSSVSSATNGILYLNNTVKIEVTTGHPSYNLFIKNYFSVKNTVTDYIILQGHPNSYIAGSTDLEQFKLIIQFLISEGVEFVRPYDYYRLLHR
jgi:peptidoglycan/xylan/chitin deacetylase (PgdA/CDA1 family)